ncbi:uncharacterized protein LOC117345126 [Pecten maximus]|uniref:uncharacterized protein LOC117345126 n=1 Tax=Pecten maximus TaxID=6579 RepID=UPI001459022F|nr:uncharacterized protein LOC117345126 [Pecten maximus]
MRGLVLFCFVVHVSISLNDGEPVSTCPGGRRPVRCFINPCDLPRWKTCNNNPTLQCRANYCQGCEHVQFYDVNGVKVNCNDDHSIQKDQQKPVAAFEAHKFWPFSDLYARIKSLLYFKT